MKRMFNLLRGDGRRWRTSVSAPLRSGFQYRYRRSLFALRRGLAWRIAGVSRRLSWRFIRTLTLIERRQELARRERAANAPLAPHVLDATREREEERRFRETVRAHSVPAPDRAYTDRPAHPAQLAHSESFDQVSLMAAQFKTPLTTNAGLPICVLKTPPSFTASVMARVSAANTPGAPAATPTGPTPHNTKADAPPASDAPAALMETRFPSAPPGRVPVPVGAVAASGASRVSAGMLWRHGLALVGVYGVSAVIVLCSGWLFARLDPGLVFSLLSALVNIIILVIATFGIAWRMSNGAIGGVGVLYLLLLALLAPMLLVVSQAPRMFASARREA